MSPSWVACVPSPRDDDPHRGPRRTHRSVGRRGRGLEGPAHRPGRPRSVRRRRLLRARRRLARRGQGDHAHPRGNGHRGAGRLHLPQPVGGGAGRCRALADPDARRLRPDASEWRWWRHAVLRAPGFPAAGVLRLAAPELARRAEELAAGDSSASAEEFERAFAAAVDETAAALGEIAASPRFRTAVAWQNHRLLETGLESLLRGLAEGGPRRSAARRREELVARYWQRYCVKNDTIGFFGPVGWARVDEAAPSTSLRPGERLLDGCDVLFEPWAVETLARAIASEPGVSEWLPPAPEPYVVVEDGKLLVPGAPPRELAPLDAAVLRRCDGVTPARRIADTLVERSEAASTDAVLAALERLRRRRLVRPPLDLPFGLRPERELPPRRDPIRDSAV